MKSIIKTASFVKGVVGEDAVMYDGTPHIAFIGRSNVGKSSTINAVLDRNKLVKVGNTPGKTREINFFKVTTVDNKDCYLVDLPGYGYAIASNKIDKINQKTQNQLKIDLVKYTLPDTEIFYCSASKGKNIHLLQKFLFQ